MPAAPFRRAALCAALSFAVATLASAAKPQPSALPLTPEEQRVYDAQAPGHGTALTESERRARDAQPGDTRVMTPAELNARDAQARTTATVDASEARAREAAMPAGTGLFQAEGVRLPYLRQGDGEVVIVLPDTLEGLESWRPQVASLGERFATVAYVRRDMLARNAAAAMAAAPGAPAIDPEFTAALATDPASVTGDARAVRDFVMFAASLSRGPVHVIGEGEGARLALRLAIECPDRIRSVVVSAPDPHWFPRDAAMEAARAGAALPAAADTSLSFRKLWRTTVPVLFVTGERDPRAFAADWTPLRFMRNAREIQLRGAGTRPHVHASDDFNRTVARFLERQRMTAEDQ